nr:MAG TPA: hypothetical protein [Bacteriophage sp.]DAT14405.1 MAG TPA: hypothetical protein [Caudoviricetes sp.]
MIRSNIFRIISDFKNIYLFYLNNQQRGLLFVVVEMCVKWEI